MQIKGGEKLKAALDKIAQSVTKPATLQVGFLEGATYPDGKSVAMIAAIQNFGAPSRGIPPRPFFSNMVKDKSPEWPEALGKVLVAKNYDAAAALELMGHGIKGQLQESIVDTLEPPLSPITVMLRGMRSNNPDLKVSGATVGEAAKRVADGKTNYGASTKPLVDSGDMLNAVDSTVKT